MSRPRLLDLFSGAGGAAMGYHRAGFEVVGVDIASQPDYPFEFHQADALAFLAQHGHEFEAIHASPPCQSYSTGVSSRSSQWVPTLGKDEPALIAPTHALLVELGRPWVIENVMGARPQMPTGLAGPFILCGSMFSRPIPRHRVFSSSVWVPVPEHPDCAGLAKRTAAELGWEYRDMSVTGKGRRAGTAGRWSHLLGIDWKVSQHQLAEAIPPAYTEYIGKQLLDHIANEEAA